MLWEGGGVRRQRHVPPLRTHRLNRYDAFRPLPAASRRERNRQNRPQQLYDYASAQDLRGHFRVR